MTLRSSISRRRALTSLLMNFREKNGWSLRTSDFWKGNERESSEKWCICFTMIGLITLSKMQLTPSARTTTRQLFSWQCSFSSFRTTFRQSAANFGRSIPWRTTSIRGLPLWDFSLLVNGLLSHDEESGPRQHYPLHYNLPCRPDVSLVKVNLL